CPAFTKVVLVEEVDKEAFIADYERSVVPLTKQVERQKAMRVMKKLLEMLERMWPDHSKGRLYTLESLEIKVRETVPADRLLVWRYGDGWEPLCEFLDVKGGAPEEPFPSYDNGVAEVMKMHDRMRRANKATATLLVFLAVLVSLQLFP